MEAPRAQIKGEIMQGFIRTGLLAAAVTLAGCQAESTDDGVTVQGTGWASAAPDALRVSLAVSSAGPDREAALREASAISDDLAETLPLLEGLDWIELHRNEANIRPVYEDTSCRQQYNRPAGCQPSGHQVSIAIAVRAGPAERAGDLISLASELGATSSDIDGFYVVDSTAHKDEARAAAVQDARRQAEGFAAASGMALGSIASIRSGQQDYYYQLADADAPRDSADRLMVTAERRRAPDIELAVDPEIRRYSETVTVRFELVERTAD